MARKHHKPEEIVSKLRQVDVLVGQGTARADAIRQVSITEQTYYRWRKQYGGMHWPTGDCKAIAERRRIAALLRDAGWQINDKRPSQRCKHRLPVNGRTSVAA